MASCQLSGSGELIQPAAVGSPLIVVKVNHAATSSDSLASRSAPIQCRVNSIVIVIVPELQQLSLEICRSFVRLCDQSPQALRRIARTHAFLRKNNTAAG